MSERALLLLNARAYLAAAREFRDRPVGRGFAFTLLAWAANCRRRAAAVEVQRDLFGAAA